MDTVGILEFEDPHRRLRGKKIPLDPEDDLYHQAARGFLSRGIEVSEIRKWADRHNLELMEEYHVDIRGGKNEVVTYSYIPHQMKSPEPRGFHAACKAVRIGERGRGRD